MTVEPRAVEPSKILRMLSPPYATSPKGMDLHAVSGIIPLATFVIQFYRDSSKVKHELAAVTNLTTAHGFMSPHANPAVGLTVARKMWRRPVAKRTGSRGGAGLRQRHLAFSRRHHQAPHLFQAVVPAHFFPE